MQLGWGPDVEVLENQAEEVEALLWSQRERISPLVLFRDVGIRGGRNGNGPALILGTRWSG